MGFDLDRLERLAGGLAVLFYVLLFLAFITAVMGSGGGGLLLLGLGAVAHVGRVGLEDFVERRREFGDVAGAEAGDAGERAIGLHLKWLPEIHLPREIRLPRRIDPGAIRSRAGTMLATARADVRTSFAALVAEIRERPAGAARHSFSSPHQGVENASRAELGEDDGSDYGRFLDDFSVDDAFEEPAEDFAFTDSRYEDFDGTEGGDEEIPAPEFVSAPAPTAGAPTAQERYEARQRARAERGDAEPIAAAVEAAETQRPQRVQRRQPGGRPDPLRTRRPTRSF